MKLAQKPLQKIEGETYSLLKTYMIKRRKQRFEKLSIIRYILRILMLTSRLTNTKTSNLFSPITFAFFGLVENAIGLVRMFNINKRSIQLGKFSNDRQKQMLETQRTEKVLKKTQMIENWENVANRIEYGAQYIHPAVVQDDDCSSVDIQSSFQPHLQKQSSSNQPILLHGDDIHRQCSSVGDEDSFCSENSADSSNSAQLRRMIAKRNTQL